MGRLCRKGGPAEGFPGATCRLGGVGRSSASGGAGRGLEAWGDSLGLCLGPMGCHVGRGLEWSEWQQLPWEAKWLRGSDRTWQDGFGGGEGAV